MDIVIPISVNNVETVIRNKNFFIHNLSAKKIIVIGNEQVGEMLSCYMDIEFLNENNLYEGLSFYSVKELISKLNTVAVKRTGWYLQQFLKMAYAFVCKENSYLVWDSDTIPLVPLSFVNSSGEYLYSLKKNEFHKTYFRTMGILLPGMKEKNSEGSYITEHMIFDCKIMKQLICDIEKNQNVPGNNFYEKIIYSIDRNTLPLSGFSEFETYGTYVYNFFKDKYTYREIKPMRHGRIYFGDNPSESDLIWASQSYDTISFEHFEHEWYFLSFITKVVSKKMTMNEWDNYIGKIISVYHKFRRFVKEVINR